MKNSSFITDFPRYNNKSRFRKLYEAICRKARVGGQIKASRNGVEATVDTWERVNYTLPITYQNLIAKEGSYKKEDVFKQAVEDVCAELVFHKKTIQASAASGEDAGYNLTKERNHSKELRGQNDPLRDVNSNQARHQSQ